MSAATNARSTVGFTEFAIDVIIAVHSAQRPVERAAASVLRHSRTDIRLTIVCHNLATEIVRERLGALFLDKRVRLLTHTDDAASPSGPFNAGIAAATAPFVSIMGSDDELELGAIDSWMHIQQATAAQMVIARLAHAGGAVVPTPPVRPFRRAGLDPVKDRLSYRSAPLGMFSRSTFPSLRLVEGMKAGGDVELVTTIWFSGARIALDKAGPAYLIHDDADDRVTTVAKPISTDVAFMTQLMNSEVLHSLTTIEKQALVIKMFRIHLFGLVHNRADAELWSSTEREALADITARWLAVAPRAIEPLSRSDRALIESMLDPRTDVSALLSAARDRRRFLRPSSLIPSRVTWMFHREAPLRFIVASSLIRGWRWTNGSRTRFATTLRRPLTRRSSG